ncbi:MAG TPA: hypothetical protein VJQ82_01770 [Terriglobales bacterium]|nr:hypothetical protein [Terriglobales bacterium]
MNKTLQIALSSLALVGTYCAISSSRNPVPDLQHSTLKKAVLYADGTEPMPACRKGFCPPAEN